MADCHAILILAHKDIAQVTHLAEYFSAKCELYIHIDKRLELRPTDRKRLVSMPQVRYVCQQYAAHWGGMTLLRAELHLLEVALTTSHATHFHLISGQDYPTKALRDFLWHFEQNAGKNYVEYQPRMVSEWSRQEQWRYRYYLPYDHVNARSNRGRQTIGLWRKLQEYHGFSRPLPHFLPLLCKGSQWFSICREAAQTVVDYTNSAPAFLRSLNFTFAPEETYIVTVILNLIPHENIVNNNLRFVLWTSENGSNPSILDLSHLAAIQSSGALFARKVQSPISDDLTCALRTSWL